VATRSEIATIYDMFQKGAITHGEYMKLLRDLENTDFSFQATSGMDAEMRREQALERQRSYARQMEARQRYELDRQINGRWDTDPVWVTTTVGEPLEWGYAKPKTEFEKLKEKVLNFKIDI
jgi:hypothetical protein